MHLEAAGFDTLEWRDQISVYKGSVWLPDKVQEKKRDIIEEALAVFEIRDDGKINQSGDGCNDGPRTDGRCLFRWGTEKDSLLTGLRDRWVQKIIRNDPQVCCMNTWVDGGEITQRRSQQGNQVGAGWCQETDLGFSSVYANFEVTEKAPNIYITFILHPGEWCSEGGFG